MRPLGRVVARLLLERMLVAVAVAVAVLPSGRAAAGGEARPAPASLPAAIDRSIERRMQAAGIVGLGAAIIVHRKLVWARGYGFADRERAVPFTRDTIMNVGSISKTVTGAALMRAVQDGKLSLDADVNRYLPFQVANPSFPDEPITLRQLATHTSSITDRGPAYAAAYHFGRDAPQSLGGFLRDYFAPNGKDYSKENFLAARPGTHREYSNIGAALAAYVVERAVGEPFTAYTRRVIFAPLKMASTGWLMSEVDLAKHSTLYVAQGLVVPIQLYGLATYPDGGLRTSVEELSRFFIALLDGGASGGARILDEATVAELLRFQYGPANRPDNVKLSGEGAVNSGIFWATKDSLTRIGHNGADPGLVTMMLSDVDRELGVILFVNTAVRQEDGAVYGAIFEELWKLGLQLQGAGAQVVRPVPSKEVPALRAFLQGYLRRSSADEAGGPRYTAASVELCRGKGAWIVAHVVGQSVCGSGGCTTLVLAPEKGGYRIVADIAPNRPPIMVLSDRTEGCHDLAVSQRGAGAAPGRFEVFLFDGSTWSEMPGDSPAHQRRASRAGVEVIAGSDSFGTQPVFDPVAPPASPAPAR